MGTIPKGEINLIKDIITSVFGKKFGVNEVHLSVQRKGLMSLMKAVILALTFLRNV